MDRRQLRGALYGRRALEQLAVVIAPAEPALELDLAAVTRADTYTGVVLRAAIERHLRAGQQHRVDVRPPRDSAARATIDTLLDPWPSRCVRATEPRRGTASPNVHMPTLTIEDENDLLMLTQLVLPTLAARRALRVRDARTLQRAVMAVGHNALQHGAGGARPPILGVALEPMGNELQLVVTDFGPGAGAEGVRGAVARSREALGSLESLVLMAQPTGVDLSLRLVSGPHRAHWRHGRWRYQEGVHVPGWTAAVEIHL